MKKKYYSNSVWHTLTDLYSKVYQHSNIKMNMKSFELTFRWRERDGRLFVVNSKSRMLPSPQGKVNFLQEKGGVNH